jgi:hypothetical protein
MPAMKKTVCGPSPPGAFTIEPLIPERWHDFKLTWHFF